MSIIVKELALHNLDYQKETGQVRISSSTPFLPETLTERVEHYVETLHKGFNIKPSKGYAAFSDEKKEGSESFQESLDSYLGKSTAFGEFSNQVSRNFVKEIEKYGIVENGCLTICHYEYMGGRFLYIGVIPETEHYSLSNDFGIKHANHLNTNKVTLAARIDLFNYSETEEQKYITFIRGRAGRAVRDFFMDAIGGKETFNIKESTIVLTNALEDYMASNQFDQREKQVTRKEIISHCKERTSTGEEVTLAEINQLASPESNNQEFANFVKDQEYGLEEKFPLDQKLIEKTSKYKGYGNGISIGFDKSQLGNEVVYNPSNDSLTIYKVPPNLKQQLLELLAKENSEQTKSAM